MSRARWSSVAAGVVVALAAGALLPTAWAGPSANPGRSVFVPITPCRLFDYRPPPDTVGSRATPLQAQEVYTQQITGPVGNCAIPTTATAVAMNMTMVGPTANSFLTVWPADASRPVASSLNWTPASPPTPNKVDVKLSVAGAIDLYNLAGTVNVLSDAVGYYEPEDSSQHILRYPPSALVPLAGALTLDGTTGWCADPVSLGHAFLPIVLPQGARLVSVDVATRNTANTFTIELERFTLGSGGNSAVMLDSEPAGGVNGSVTHALLTHSPPIMVGAGESYSVEFDPMYAAFCEAVVTYDADG